MFLDFVIAIPKYLAFALLSLSLSHSYTWKRVPQRSAPVRDWLAISETLMDYRQKRETISIEALYKGRRSQ